jgi:hypothetical protein
VLDDRTGLTQVVSWLIAGVVLMLPVPESTGPDRSTIANSKEKINKVKSMDYYKGNHIVRQLNALIFPDNFNSRRTQIP